MSGQSQKLQDPPKVTGRLQATGIPLKRTGKMRLHGFTGWA
jgi:hypothetical protein